ncbi:3-hydroxyacyl-CoA dehydrogenase NAD-binding domain-containing protein [Steroidobacter sp.]|uniref:3-hydroxyacyl-CoA dehydrogenase NAD-binding domain-containing protein n=1 Tax=Steroidobacter sp. TaxID=1978227 RepID=UPI001A4F08C2|nr:3-hydroxyacyl-CoA dehydrogenase NAD-binding domain-containing protein [Steroidobacter sp.]MBL8270969.1 enoyl-CoA hydratase/isomerase family protein [Steroidobacter sp.]
MKTLQLDVDADGIALITLDAPDKPMNVVSPQFIDDMIAAIERVASDAAIKGAIITSGKPAFMAGADLKYILGIAGGALTLKQAYAFSQKPSVQMHRRLETCGKPFVAAINGLALGGGYELALACHHRVIVDDPKAVVGLPEVTVGLLPGSGGTQRLARMVGVEKAAALLLDGRQVPPAEALQLGMVDQVVPAADLLGAARAWLLKSPNAVRVWDVKGYRSSNGLLNPTIVKVMSERPAQIAASTRRNYPAPIAILDCLFQGLLLPFDKALQVESKHFARLLCDPVARNLIRTSFVNRGEATKLARRPNDVPKSKVTRVGVLGAGMMGSGIAYVSALAGIDVVLLDSTAEQAEKGKQYSVKLLAKSVERGKQTQAAADAILARIKATTDYQELAGCELVVEAVFEDVGIKADVTKRAEAVLGSSAIFASNTSTLPITKLAEASTRAAQFIGLHFFSPVDRMPLVEVIIGGRTSQETLAKSLDYVAQLRMTPIVVNDSRGFYTSRVFQTFIHEGMRMLEEGIEPARIENAAIAAGFPVGPLALLDEVTIELPWKIVQESEAALGANYVRPCAYDVMRRMLYEIKRPGRRHGGGFYEYPAEAPKRLWSGLSAAFPPARKQPEVAEIRDRLLYIQSLETARCMEEGVVAHPADADVGALLGWGFPAWTGGPLSLIETVGLEKFVAQAERMAAKYGPRFGPSDWLRARAEQGESFYQTAAPRTAAA